MLKNKKACKRLICRLLYVLTFRSVAETEQISKHFLEDLERLLAIESAV